MSAGGHNVKNGGQLEWRDCAEMIELVGYGAGRDVLV